MVADVSTNSFYFGGFLFLWIWICSLRWIVGSLETSALIKSSIHCRRIHLQEFSARTNKLASSVKQPPPVLVKRYGRNNWHLFLILIWVKLFFHLAEPHWVTTQWYKQLSECVNILYNSASLKSIFHLQTFMASWTSDEPRNIYFRKLLGGGAPAPASSGCSVQTAGVVHRLRILVASSVGLNGGAATLCLFKDDLFYDFIVSVFARCVGLCGS